MPIPTLGVTFTIDDKHYQAGKDSKFFIQIGKRSKSGKIRYEPRGTFGPEQIGQCFAYFRGYNIAAPYVKRLSYRPSTYSARYELAKIIGE
jgi:hypothetical protein